MTKAIHIVTVAEAAALIRSIKGQKTFCLMVRSWMPTEGNRGFEGCAAISVKQTAFMAAMTSMLSGPFADKGAKLRLHIDPPMFDGFPTHIACY